MSKIAKFSPRSSGKNKRPGFTLIELLTVMAIIIALAGLVIMSAGYAQNKAARSRAEAEIAALSAACESYKADQGCYPTPVTQLVGSGSSNLNPANPATAPTYWPPSRALYQALSGDGNTMLTTTGTLVPSDGNLDKDSQRYMEFKPKMLGPTASGTINYLNVYVQDPFGYSYGYYAPNTSGTVASSGTAVIYNPTFDLWSTGGRTGSSGTSEITTWIKNW